MSDALLEFWRKMEESSSYLKMAHLKDGYSYKIWARDAYVGIWIKNESGFLISRYKVGKNPNLFTEYHWDIGTALGTVKPLTLIEECPLVLKEKSEKNEDRRILKYLDDLEENHPPINGVNTLQDRKVSAIRFGQRLAGKVSSN